MFRNASLLLFVLPAAISLGAGEHLKFMAPFSRQHDSKGKPKSILERHYEISPGGGRELDFTSLFEYPKIDENGNWLTQVNRKTARLANGQSVPLPDEIVEREITYHE